MNWGHKLAIVFVGFAVLIGTLVYKCTQHKFDLVSDDYYNQELKFQDKIDGSKAAAAISPVKISQTPGDIFIQMPEEMKGLSLEGDVWLYCASDAANDVKLPLSLDANGIMEINKQKVPGTNYTVKISWNSSNNKYYKELPLTVTKQ
ncbi:FixH family protein [Parafilimonas terrae]|uniref:FixH protein n=1 Tax=Parafilimonas terrae TaxID=1465490 RepID=A0A1I5SS06_9BACT|nr:FixH family protein [Parafilimonas terrae]SFP73297.1 FixH protein [Parafilimonas terrae]